MESTDRPVLKIVLFLGLVAALALVFGGCKTFGPTPTPVPIANGVLDCGGPALFKVATFATLVPIVEHAIAQKDPIGALEDLLKTYGEAEITCVVAYLADLGATQAAASPTNPVVKNRVTVTAQWLARETAKGIGPIVNYGTLAQ